MFVRYRAYVMTLPSVLIFSLFYLYPIVYMIIISLTDWDFLSTSKSFLGLRNYTELLSDEIFLKVVQNSLVFTLSAVLLNIGIAFALAVWLNRTTLWQGIVQASVISPYMISMVSVSLLWMWMMDPQYGLLNVVLTAVGLPSLEWLRHPETAMLSIVIVYIWKHVGFNALVILAGLQSIAKNIYEAAQLDRTPLWRTLYKITLPMISPTLFFLVVIGMINSFQVFETVAIMTQGGPMYSTNMFVYYIYENGFRFFNIGYASAAGVILMLIIAALTLIHFMYLERKVHY